MSDVSPFWTLAVIAGPIILAAVLAMVILRNRRLTRAQDKAGEAATRRLYETENAHNDPVR